MIVDLFSSVWTGITLAVILFFYCSIGSAMPFVRQLPYIEMTEFEWFNWWPFGLLIGLLTINIAVITVRRIPLRKVNAGVWMIHSGIIVLSLGSYYYFTTKVEGDAPVFRRQVRIDLPGMSGAKTLVALPGSRARVDANGERWEFEVQSTNTNWPILSDEHKGEVAYAVNVMVTPPDGESFIRQLLAGYPQYTEDVIPGKGRAIKSTGKKLLRDELSMSLEYHPTTYFQVVDTWALFVRKVGETEWTQRPIEGLPRYNERISSRELVFTDPSYPVPLRPIDLTIPSPAEGDALSNASVHVTGYLRYAKLQRRWHDGGRRVNPVLNVSFSTAQGNSDSFELLAMDPTRYTAGNGNIEFLWLRDESQVASLPKDSRAVLRIRLAEDENEMEVPITSDSLGGDFRPIGDGTFSYRIKNVQDRLTVPGQDQPVSIAIVEIKTPEKTITRWVADRPGMSRDMRSTGGDPHSSKPSDPDPRVVTQYQPGSAPLIFAGYPGGLHFIFNGAKGREIDRVVARGESIEMAGGLTVHIDGYMENGVSETKPFVVPPSSREPKVHELFSMIRLEIESGGRTGSRWVPFNRYVLPDRQYAYQGRFAYLPERFRLADGTMVEVMFSRQRRELPAAVTLDSFEIDSHVGGYSGSASTIRNYISRLRFNDGSGWTEPVAIKVNSPTEFDGLWFFQSSWDKPPGDNPGGGMNFTGLGIGNRNGVYIQLAGCCLAVIGMIFAFYVKPMIKRKRAMQSRARVSRSISTPNDKGVPADAPQAVGV